MTQELLTELSTARRILSSPGKRTDLVTYVTRSKTWQEYCEDIGIERMTAHRWLAAFEVGSERVHLYGIKGDEWAALTVALCLGARIQGGRSAL